MNFDLFVGYDINDVRPFLDYAKTGNYVGAGTVTMERVEIISTATELDYVLWRPKYKSQTLAFYIRAVDDSGNVGQPSNVASALSPFPILLIY